MTSGGTDGAAGVSAEGAIVEAMVVAVAAGMEEAIGGEVVVGAMVVGAMVGVADEGVTPGAMMLKSKSSLSRRATRRASTLTSMRRSLSVCCFTYPHTHTK